MPKKTMPNPAEGLFDNIPRLNNLFTNFEHHIRYFRKSKFFPETTKESLIRERDVLIEEFKKMDEIDIRVIYYLHNISGISSYTLYQLLQKEYRAQCERKNYLEHTDTHQDPF